MRPRSRSNSALLPVLSLSIAYSSALGAAINYHRRPSRDIVANKKNAMGHSPSSLSSLERGTASIERDDGARGYVPPSSPVRPMAHYVFLVHGWMGNDLEQDYLSRALHRRAVGTPDRDDDDDYDIAEGVVPPDAKRARQDGDADVVVDASQNNVVVYSPRCNVGRTHDGIRAGGARLANEVVEFVRSDVTRRLLLVGGDEGRRDDDVNDDAAMRSPPPNEEDVHVTYSIVGNSLGGLYARYAISLLPYRLSLSSRRERHPTNERTGSTTSSIRLNLHPNVFCTTATPHLGVSRHTYLPLPRIAETIIGTGMRATGRDLFRLKSDSSLRGRSFISTRSDSSGGLVGKNTDGDGVESGKDDDGDDERMECIVRNMCLQDRYLSPLRCFRHRIAYANAYGTDFQVPTSTAAFLNESSGVAHRLVASRSENGAKEGGGCDEEGEGGVPSFIVAVCRTEKQDSLSSRAVKSYSGGGDLDDDLLLMSQSLDALGWTKVFIDVRDCLPVAGMPTPSWLRSTSGTLDNLIRERMGLRFRSLMNDTNDVGCILTSQELAQSTSVSDSINIPLGHAVMVANSKSERYAQLNSAGRPVMDKLATDMMDDIFKFE